jgi:hypothetical protein
MPNNVIAYHHSGIQKFFFKQSVHDQMRFDTLEKGIRIQNVFFGVNAKAKSSFCL